MSAHSQGVLCGCDTHQEWLLPWWWSRLKEHSDWPVTFCDFGMSREAREWCRERGTLHDIDWDPAWVTPREAINEDRVVAWESMYGPGVWSARESWFKKPLALLSTPYQKTVWLDLDCEVLSSISPLFEMQAPISLVREMPSSHLPLFHPEIKYNSGVLVFDQGVSLIKMWEEASRYSNHLFWGDDPLLSHLISREKYPVHEMSEVWNWRMSDGFCMNAKIYHWVGSGGKGFIRERGGIKSSLDSFYAACGKKEF
jgi:hypothetical protein